MDVISVLSNLILVTIAATVFLAVGSYLAYKVRETRRPKTPEREKPPFFRKYEPKQGAGSTEEPGPR